MTWDFLFEAFRYLLNRLSPIVAVSLASGTSGSLKHRSSVCCDSRACRQSVLDVPVDADSLLCFSSTFDYENPPAHTRHLRVDGDPEQAAARALLTASLPAQPAVTQIPRAAFPPGRASSRAAPGGVYDRAPPAPPGHRGAGGGQLPPSVRVRGRPAKQAPFLRPPCPSAHRHARWVPPAASPPPPPLCSRQDLCSPAQRGLLSRPGGPATGLPATPESALIWAGTFCGCRDFGRCRSESSGHPSPLSATVRLLRHRLSPA